MLTKECTRCAKVLPATHEHFTKAAKGKYGFEARCRDCARIVREENKEVLRERKRLHYQENRERLKKKQNDYYYANKEQILLKQKEYSKGRREENEEYAAKYYQENKDLIKQRMDDWRKANPERAAESVKNCYARNASAYKETSLKWVNNNRDAITRYRQNRRARLKETPYNFPVEEWEVCKEHFGNSCAYCGSFEPLAQDHFMPLSKGGEYTKDNIIPACIVCNGSKSDRNFFEWYPERESYTKARKDKILKYLNYHNNSQQLSIL